MNDPLALLRERLLPQPGHGRHSADRHTPDPVQMLTAKLLLFTGLGTAADAFRNGPAGSRGEAEEITGSEPERGIRRVRPTAWAPALLGAAAAISHAVYAFAPSERTRLATRTFDVAVVSAGLLSLADTLAAARRDGKIPSLGSVSLATAGLLGILIDRSESRHEAERQRLERRASVVERLVPRRQTKFDRLVVHV